MLVFKFPSSQATGTEYEEAGSEMRFPRAGTPNAKSKLKLVQFTLSETLQIQDIMVKDLQIPLTYFFPWMEYIVRVGWMPDARSIWAQLLNRQQKRVDLIMIPLDNFSEVCSNSSAASSPSGGAVADHSWRSTLNKVTSPIQVIFSQCSSAWVNINDLLTFVDYNDHEVTFIWGSEESGFRHLYLITSSLRQTMNGVVFSNTAHAPASRCGPDDEYSGASLVPRIVSKTALTAGEWEVLGRHLWIDRARALVYFMGLRETPLEKHLYVVNMKRPDCVRLLSKQGYSHTVEFNEDCTIMIQIYCNIHQMPACEVFHLTHANEMDGGQGWLVGSIQLKSLGFLFEGGIPTNPQLQKFSPSIHSRHISSGEVLYAMVFRPHNFRRGQRYPTVLNVYGGPEVQTVNNTYKVSFHFDHLVRCILEI